MSTFRVDILQNRSGGATTLSGQVAAKQWASFNTVALPAVINRSFNTSSLTDIGTGDASLTFTSAMSDANYCFSLSLQVITSSTSGIGHSASELASPTITTTRIRTYSSGGTTADAPIVTQQIVS
jgi:hypothetical protein